MESATLTARVGKLGLVSASVLVCLAGGELVMRQLHSLPSLPEATTRTEKARLYGWAPLPGQLLTSVDPETRRPVVSRANSQGWRDVEHALAKPPGHVRILFVGDSFTYGTVALDALYTRRVEAKLHALGHGQVEVISIGVGGWGTDQELEAIRNEGLRYEPDLVIYQFCSNDTINLDPPPELHGDFSLGSHKPFRFALQNDRLVRIDHASVEAARSAGSLSWLHAPLRLSALFRTLSDLLPEREVPVPVPDPSTDRLAGSGILARYGIVEMEKPWALAAWRLLAALVVEMRAVASAHGVPLLVFSESGEPGMRRFLLERGEVVAEGGADFVVFGGRKLEVDLQLPLRRLQGICERNGIPLIAPRRSYVRYGTDWHTNAAGNENMASDIVDFLVAWPAFQAILARSAVPPPAS